MEIVGCFFVTLGSILGLLVELICAKIGTKETKSVADRNNIAADEVGRDKQCEKHTEEIEIETHL